MFSIARSTPRRFYAKRQELEGLSSAVEQLPSSFRSVIDKVYEGECPVQEDAHTVGISVAATKSRLVRTRLMLCVALRNNACQSRIGLLSNLPRFTVIERYFVLWK
jgi:DNA-directed RNA polymerase specialized sigma24 family protein